MINLRISKRLKTIASFIDKDDKTIYDVGCDHALLDIYLANKYKSISFYAMDISPKCIEKANENIKKYDFKDRIKTIVNDGLKSIDISNGSTLIISGMGAHTIINILNDCDIKKLKKIIVQSNNDLELLRRRIVNMGFLIKKEVTVFDKKHYVIMLFVPGEKDYSATEYAYGPELLKNINANRTYFQFLYDKYNQIYKNIPFLKVYGKLKLFFVKNKIKKLLKK